MFLLSVLAFGKRLAYRMLLQFAEDKDDADWVKAVNIGFAGEPQLKQFVRVFCAPRFLKTFTITCSLWCSYKH